MRRCSRQPAKHGSQGNGQAPAPGVGNADVLAAETGDAACLDLSIDGINIVAYRFTGQPPYRTSGRTGEPLIVAGFAIRRVFEAKHPRRLMPASGFWSGVPVHESPDCTREGVGVGNLVGLVPVPFGSAVPQ